MLHVKDDFDVNLSRLALFWFAAFVVIALVLRLGDWLAGWMLVFALEEWRP